MVKMSLLFLLTIFYASCATTVVDSRNDETIRVMSHSTLGVHENNEDMASSVYNNIRWSNYRVSSITTDPWAEENVTSLRSILVSETIKHLNATFLNVHDDTGRTFRVNLLKGNQRYIVFFRIVNLYTVSELYPLGVIQEYANLVFEVW